MNGNTVTTVAATSGSVSTVSCVYAPAQPRNAGVYPINCSGPLVVGDPNTSTLGVSYVGAGAVDSKSTAPYYNDVNGQNPKNPGSLTINPSRLTLTAQPNTKIYDSSGTANAVPTVTGLKYNADTVTNLAETYDTRHARADKALVVSSYTVNDGNPVPGKNYCRSTGAGLPMVERPTWFL